MHNCSHIAKVKEEVLFGVEYSRMKRCVCVCVEEYMYVCKGTGGRGVCEGYQISMQWVSTTKGFIIVLTR